MFVSHQAVVRVVCALPSTVLFIMHRLQHVRDFDLVLVMAAGRVAEFGPPLELLAHADGLLYSMVHAGEAKAGAGAGAGAGSVDGEGAGLGLGLMKQIKETKEDL